ncbi:MAG TPA: thiamine pyrophosphate-dependent enzyme [Burkholderiales bacterium]|nr:thiamine pyrophosphate-dependent enzyme [Burkholderiales bacterium]
MDRPPHLPVSGRAAFLQLLSSEGVTQMFGNPGTTELPIMDALAHHPGIHYVLALQEALVVAMADGYARATGRLAAANVHVAPGLGNAMGSLYNAKFYGSPVLLTAGQQEQGHGLMEPMLYDPLVPIAQPLVKWAVEVTRVQDLPRIVRRAAKVAMTPPTGPVFISLPGDILDDEAPLDLGQPTHVDAAVRPSDAALERLADRLLAAENPVLVAGHELATRHALDEAAQLAEALGAPVFQQTVPYAAHFLSEHRAFLGALTRNQAQVRGALQPYDLAVFLGADVLRMSVHSKVDALPEDMPVVQIGERDWELGKNYPAQIAINADVKETLRALIPVLKRRMAAARAAQVGPRLLEIEKGNWSAKRAKLAAEAAAAADRTPLDPRVLMMHISDAIPKDAVVVEEGLTSTFSLQSFLRFRDPQGFYGLASGGIGFAMAGAVGISLGLPSRPVVAIVGDGSAMYSIQALWTAAHLKLPITYVIPNNRSYRILKERLVSMRKTEKFIGMDMRDPAIDFVALAQSLGVPARRITTAAEIGPALKESIAAGGPRLLDVAVADGFGG